MTTKPHFEFIPFVVFILKISAAICSVILTVQYMRDLGAGTNNQLLFSILGIIFDTSKLIFPALAMKAIYEYRGIEAGLRCLLFSCLSVFLILLSGMASFQSLENSGDSLLTNSARYHELTQQIDELRGNESSLVKLNYRTKGEQLRVERYQLINERNALKPESTTARNWREISFCIAALIELISISLVLASSKKDEYVFPDISQNKSTQTQVTQVTKIKDKLIADYEPAIFVAKQIESIIDNFDNRIQQKDLIMHGIKANGTTLKQAFNLLAEKGVVYKSGKYWQVIK